MYQALLYITVVLGASFLFKIYISSKQTKYNKALKSTLLRVAVSKTNERGPAVAEQIFSALHGIKANHGFFAYLAGKTKPRFSLEIANVGGKIQFFIWVPRKFKNIVESQIYAQYPDVEIEEVQDYAKQAFKVYRNMAEKVATTTADVENPDNLPALFKKEAARDQRYAVTAEMSLAGASIYPIKRHTQFEDKFTGLATEPLAGITATLSKLNATDEQAWIQLTLEPVGDEWRTKAVKCLKILSNGLFSDSPYLSSKATNALLASGFWKRLFLTPVYLLLWFFRSGAALEKKTELKEEVTSSRDREDPISAAFNKVSKISYAVNLRMVYLPRKENIDLAELKLSEMASSFKQFDLPSLNRLKVSRINTANAQILKRYQQRLVLDPMMLNVEEIATLYHMPSKDVGTPNVLWVNSRRLEPPHNLPAVVTVPDT